MRSNFRNALTLFFVLLLSLQAPAQEQPGAPADGQTVPVTPVASSALTLEKVQEKIKEIEAMTELDEELKKKVLELYRQAEGSFQKAREYQTLAEQYKQAIESAPKQAEELRNKLATEPEAPKLDVPPGVSSQELEALRTKEQAELATLKTALEQKKSAGKELQERAGKIPEQQAQAKQKIEEIDKSLKAETAAGEAPLLTGAARAAFESRKKMRTQELAMLDQELLSHAARLKLLEAERDYQTRSVSQSEAKIRQFEERESRIKSEEAKKLQGGAAALKREAADSHTAIQEIADENDKLSTKLKVIRKRADAAREDRLAIEELFKQVSKGTETQSEDVWLYGRGGAAMRSKRQWLREVLHESRNLSSRWRGQIANAEYERFDLSTKERKLKNLDQELQRIADGQTQPLSPAEVQKLQDGLQLKRKILTELEKNYDSFLQDLRTVESVSAELDKTIAKFSNLLDERLFWIPSATLPNISFFSDLIDAVMWAFSPQRWWKAGTAFLTDSQANPLLFLCALLVIGVLIVYRGRMRSQIQVLAGSVRKRRTDRFKLTIWALAFTFLLAAPFALILMFLGWRLSVAGSTASAELAMAAGTAFLVMGKLFFALSFFYLLCTPSGVAEVHFRWSERTIQLLRRHLRWLLAVLLVTAFIVVLTEKQPKEEYRNSFGRLAFIALMGAQALFVQRILRFKGGMSEQILLKASDGWLSRLRYIWFPVAVGVPVVLAIAAVAGYYYTALRLQSLIVTTSWLIIGVIIAYHLFLRWLLIEERKLAEKKAREERAAARAAEQAQQEAPEGVDIVEDVPEVDISMVNEQNRKLLQTLVGVTVVVGLWMVWSGVLPALAFLDDVGLWSIQVAGDGGVDVTHWITLEHIALALVGVIITTAAARNLPGVLEILVLKHLPFDKGLRYAITSVVQYVLVAVGIVFVFNTIGIGWAKVQWLIAALSVGIGFGLQEIIANFICGLILLFERPIRVGDIVKVGDEMGVVSKIRIRATTITNWDRMDYMIPNKELITGRVLNWTLSNNVNRIVIEVGVAYGSDTEKARELLLKIVNEHPLITKDPAPLATFEGFGDNSLKMVLRCYLPDFANRLGTIHELYTTIDREFKEAGIEIAFPQLDLHLKTPIKGMGVDDPPSGGAKPGKKADK